MRILMFIVLGILVIIVLLLLICCVCLVILNVFTLVYPFSMFASVFIFTRVWVLPSVDTCIYAMHTSGSQFCPSSVV